MICDYCKQRIDQTEPYYKIIVTKEKKRWINTDEKNEGTYYLHPSCLDRINVILAQEE